MLTTNNREWGFWGTACRQGGEEFAEEAWKVAFQHVDGWMRWGEERTRDFLDSRRGRHYADTMAGQPWRTAITRAWDLESTCRAYFKEVDPQGYKRWCRFNGNSPTERILVSSGVDRQAIQKAVNNLTGLDYSSGQIEECIRRAGPLALLLAGIPEEIRDEFIAVEPEQNSPRSI